MRLLGSRYLTAVLLLGATALSALVLRAELDAAGRWALCADAMAHTFVLCDAGPGGWAAPVTALSLAVFAFGAGVAFERARNGHRVE